MATRQAAPRSPLRVTVTPEATARILARHAAGAQVQRINRELHVAPVEVFQVLQGTKRTEPAQVTL